MINKKWSRNVGSMECTVQDSLSHLWRLVTPLANALWSLCWQMLCTFFSGWSSWWSPRICFCVSLQPLPLTRFHQQWIFCAFDHFPVILQCNCPTYSPMTINFAFPEHSVQRELVSPMLTQLEVFIKMASFLCSRCQEEWSPCCCHVQLMLTSSSFLFKIFVIKCKIPLLWCSLL